MRIGLTGVERGEDKERRDGFVEKAKLEKRRGERRELKGAVEKKPWRNIGTKGRYRVAAVASIFLFTLASRCFRSSRRSTR